MADPYQDYSGNGSTTAFAVPFPYILKSHVKVFKGRDLLADTQTATLVDGNDYNWSSSGTQITTTTAPANGEILTIERQTPNGSQLSPWSDGSNLTAEALNNADLQNLYVVQEQEYKNSVGATKSIAATAAATTATNTATTAQTTADAAKLATDTYVHDGTSLKGDGVGANPQGLAYGITTATTAKTTADAAKLATDTYVHDGTSLKGDGVGSNPQGVKYAVDTSTTAKNTVNTYVHDGTSVKGDGVGSNPQGLAYAINTANTASTNASSAVSTANTASTNASNAVTTANSASSTATSATTAANTANATATSATTTANTANTTATTAKLASDRLVATTSNGGTTWTLSGNNTNASTDPKGVGYAVTTAETASTNATNAVNTANAASAAVSASVLYTPVAAVANIPGSPSDGDYVEVTNSTGIESFSPLAGLPSGFTGDAGLKVKLKYTSSGTTWNYQRYDANDSDDRYVSVYGKHNTTQVTYEVKVVTKTAAHRYHNTGSSSGFTIGGIEGAFLSLIPGNTYRFDQSDASNSGHPIGFYLDAAKVSSYTTNVSSSGTAGGTGAYTEIVISDSTPQMLSYQCQNHAYMGNGTQTNSGYVSTGDLVSKSGSQMTGNLTFSGSQTVDGRDVSVDGTKLDGIETGATADQTNAEIRTAVEAATDSNVFTDADHTKLDGIETAATADQTKSDIESLNINVNASNLNAGTIPDARFPATLPAASGANLTSLPAANLTGTLPAISGANLTNLPASGGAITATASGAIASGKGVLINANGTVSEPTLTTGSWTLNASPASSASSYAGHDITSVGDGKFIMAWRNQSNGYLMMKYISVAADGTHTWGGDITVLSTSTYNACVGWDPVNQLGIVGYRRQDYSYRAIFQTFSFSSNTITVNATTYYNSSVSSGNYSGIDITYGQDTNGVSGLMITSWIPNPMYGNLQFAYNLQMSGTPFSVSGNLSIDSSNQVQYASTAYDPDTKQWCTAWHYVSGSTYVNHARLSSVTGTSISGGSELTYESGAINSQIPNIVYDEHANKFLVQYSNSIASNSYNATYVKPLSVSGTSLSAGTRLTLPLNFQLRQMHMAYSPDIKKTVLHYQEYVSGSWNNGNSYRAEVTISGTSASCSTPTTLETISNSTVAYNPRITFDSGTKRGVLIYGFPYTVKFGTYKSGSTNIRSTNFIGLSNAAYSNGATATINVLGGVSTVQSGLTAGTEYYVQNNGTLGTAADAYEIKAGIALSSSSLLIKGN